jgi:hypothetical protein
MGTIVSQEKIRIDHAEAWINIMPPLPTAGGTLHVFVEIVSNNHGRHFLAKKVPQGINPKILMLEIKLTPEDIFIFNPQRLTYSEDLSKQDQYASVEVYSGINRLAVIDNIPLVQ